MREGIQTLFGEAGEAACYVLDEISIAEEVVGKELDVVGCIIRGIDGKFIHYSWDNAEDNDNFYIDDPAGFLGFMTGKSWTVRKEEPDYVAKPGEYVVQRWERQKVGATIGHFRRPKWDSLVSSATVRLGKIVSLRVFAVAA